MDIEPVRKMVDEIPRVYLIVALLVVLLAASLLG